ncbi:MULTISPECIES: malectin domain-containing carbohydrate-binding protein [Chitinophagaceae]
MMTDNRAYTQIVDGRADILLENGWRTTMDKEDSTLFGSFTQMRFDDADWKQVAVPHNWDDYYGYRRLLHGNLHGYAWYRKRFAIKDANRNKRYFLFFEGVGSYATVWVNGKKVGNHAGGRTTFTLDISDAVYYDGRPNIIAVRADHPAMIKDLPWVCGGCSDERGFSEGSQPMGIFRPVHLVVTNPVRIEPFGVHIWNQENAMGEKATLMVETEVKNYSRENKKIAIVHILKDKQGKSIAQTKQYAVTNTHQTIKVMSAPFVVQHPQLWSIENPYLYSIETQIWENNQLRDCVQTDYGIRYISWPVKNKNSQQFLLNGKPVFINGIAEYEHLLGGSHAFHDEEIKSRVGQIKAAGFNAFRDAHQPHNLRYQYYWNHEGILWWPQFSAHIWYDRKDFRDNFKTLLREWLKERRNDPSVIAWGLQNESKLPADFARECMAIIHEMDSSSLKQRIVNTCNGGEGTDWDVPQNWSGTYGGNPENYDQDLKKQLLVGEYGAWRSIDLHESPALSQNGKYTEEAMTDLMELKVRKAESVKDSVCGHFFWLYNSHDNPGRVQGGEGMRELDRIGPVNYKGMITPWGEPLDVYYMYRSNYANAGTDPMVYILSHTWPDRFVHAGNDNIKVYSNCEEVELFNDVQTISFGRKKRNPAPGYHFEWDSIPVRYNVLYAIGYVHGKAVAKDVVVLNHLQQSPHFSRLTTKDQNITKPNPRVNYLYRINCGGDRYQDANGNVWEADRVLDSSQTWGSRSWASGFKELNPYFASQRFMNEPIGGTLDWPLFQSFRYGREQLQYRFPLKNGFYTVELFFVEPWLGRGGNSNCKGWRLFDVAVNGNILEKKVDIWKEVGYGHALKKTFLAKVTNGLLTISFPNIEAGQAVISAIAIATADKNIAMQKNSDNSTILAIPQKDTTIVVSSWLNTGVRPFYDCATTISALPYYLYGAEWLQFSKDTKSTLRLTLKDSADLYIGVDTTITHQQSFLHGFEDMRSFVETDAGTSNVYKIFRKRVAPSFRLDIDTVGTSLFVAAQPVSNILPAYDLKDIAKYAVSSATQSGDGWQRLTLYAKESLQLKHSGLDTLTLHFNTGVADIYALTIKYANTTKKVLDGYLVLEDINGIVLKQEPIRFDISKEGKWNTYESNTGSMINAGTYQLKIATNDAAGLVVSGLEVR